MSDFGDLARLLDADVSLGACESKEIFRLGADVVSRSTEELLGELTFYRWLNGYSYVLKMHRQAIKVPDYQGRYSYVLAELQGRGVDTARDYTTRVAPVKPKVATGGVEL